MPPLVDHNIHLCNSVSELRGNTLDLRIRCNMSSGFLISACFNALFRRRSWKCSNLMRLRDQEAH
jgi:hypothetical protein